MQGINIGIIGAGRIGQLHGENLCRMENVHIKFVSDVMVDSIREWALSIGADRVTADYHEIIEDPSIDAVFICSPTETHVPIILEAAEAGKHIFCEKPISLTPSRTIGVLEKVEKSGVKIQTGFNRRFDHNFKRVHAAIQEGSIGNPHIIKITSRDPSPASQDYIKNSGGMFIDMTIHDFDMARFLVGSEVEEVYVNGAVLVDPIFSTFGDIDTSIISLKFKNGVLGVIDNSRKAVYGYDQRVEVFGSGGAVTIGNDYPNTARIITDRGAYHDKPEYFFLERYKEAYVEEVQAFFDAITNHRAVPVDLNDGLQAELIAYAAKKSLDEKRPVSLAEIKRELKMPV